MEIIIVSTTSLFGSDKGNDSIFLKTTAKKRSLQTPVDYT